MFHTNFWIAIFGFVILRVYFDVFMILSHLLEIIGYRTGCQFRSRDIQSNLPKINLNVPLAYLLFFSFFTKISSVWSYRKYRLYCIDIWSFFKFFCFLKRKSTTIDLEMRKRERRGPSREAPTPKNTPPQKSTARPPICSKSTSYRSKWTLITRYG